MGCEGGSGHWRALVSCLLLLLTHSHLLTAHSPGTCSAPHPGMSGVTLNKQNWQMSSRKLSSRKAREKHRSNYKAMWKNDGCAYSMLPVGGQGTVLCAHLLQPSLLHCVSVAQAAETPGILRRSTWPLHRQKAMGRAYSTQDRKGRPVKGNLKDQQHFLRSKGIGRTSHAQNSPGRKIQGKKDHRASVERAAFGTGSWAQLPQAVFKPWWAKLSWVM